MIKQSLILLLAAALVSADHPLRQLSDQPGRIKCVSPKAGLFIRHETQDEPCQWPPKTNTRCRREMMKTVDWLEESATKWGIPSDVSWKKCDDQGKYEWHQESMMGTYCVNEDRGFQVYAKWDMWCMGQQNRYG